MSRFNKWIFFNVKLFEKKTKQFTVMNVEVLHCFVDWQFVGHKLEAFLISADQCNMITVSTFLERMQPKNITLCSSLDSALRIFTVLPGIMGFMPQSRVLIWVRKHLQKMAWIQNKAGHNETCCASHFAFLFCVTSQKKKYLDGRVGWVKWETFYSF